MTTDASESVGQGREVQGATRPHIPNELFSEKIAFGTYGSVRLDSNGKPYLLLSGLDKAKNRTYIPIFSDGLLNLKRILAKWEEELMS